MRKEQILEDSKNYLISVHDTLLRAFRAASFEERVFIDSVLESLKQDVEQLETLKEMLSTKSIKDKKKLEMLNEE